MNTPPLFDADLVNRYDQAGPRYTSYPTAPQFGPAFAEDQWIAALQLSNSFPIPAPLSLYVHVPFCLSPCFYCGCNRVITRDRKRGEHYLDVLQRELAMMSRLIDRDRQVVQLHLGGGTPNFLSPDQIGEMLDGLQQYFHLSENPERDISIELDPRTVNASDIESLAYMGFNRASLGVQDFDPVVQKKVNRIQSVEQTLAVIQACRRHCFQSVNVDLIYGLPEQTLEGFAKTLDTVIEAKPDRLAVYSYAHIPQNFKGQTQIELEDLPSPQLKLALLQLSIEKLVAAGYQYIGMDHFALPQDGLARAQSNGSLHRNFMGYTTHANTDLIGFGVSSISHVGNTFSQNHRDIPGWEHAVRGGHLPIWRGMQMSEDDVIREDVIQELMCLSRIDKRRIESLHGIEFDSYFAADLSRLSPLEADGLLRRSPDCIEVTPRGRLLLRVIAACFDAYLHPSLAAMAETAPKVSYSRVI